MDQKKSNPGRGQRPEVLEVSLARDERDLLITKVTVGPPSHWLRIDGRLEAQFARPPADVPSLMVVVVGDLEVTLTFNSVSGRSVHPPGRGWYEVGPAGASTAWARPAIPQRPQAEIDEEARRHWGGNTEKVPTAPFRSLNVMGVMLRSRYGKRSELLALAEAVGSMPPDMRALVAHVFYDSQAGTVGASLCGELPDNAARDVATHLDVELANAGGHSGVTVEGEYREANAPDWVWP